MMQRRKRTLTLGELIQAVAQFSHNDHEMSLTVADLMQRGVIKARGRHKHFKVIAAER